LRPSFEIAESATSPQSLTQKAINGMGAYREALVTSGVVPGIRVRAALAQEDVDGRTMPGHTLSVTVASQPERRA
jgi:hypothetical protein